MNQNDLSSFLREHGFVLLKALSYHMDQYPDIPADSYRKAQLASIVITNFMILEQEKTPEN